MGCRCRGHQGLTDTVRVTLGRYDAGEIVDTVVARSETVGRIANSLSAAERHQALGFREWAQTSRQEAEQEGALLRAQCNRLLELFYERTLRSDWRTLVKAGDRLLGSEEGTAVLDQTKEHWTEAIAAAPVRT